MMDDEGRLEGKVAMITGASGGIGQAAVHLFISEGARVAALDLNTQSLKQIAASYTGDILLPLEVDVSKSESVIEAVKKVQEEYGQIDVLFNVAGVSGRRWGDGPVADCSEEAWERVMAVNLKSQFLTCKFVIPIMLANGRGSIINLSSVLGMVGGDSDFATHAYAASKGGIIALTRAIAAYYAPKGIRANVICPGLIETPMSRRAQADEHIRARLKDLQPLTGDFGSPADVAQAALYLASDQAGFITGTVLTVDGGWTVH